MNWIDADIEKPPLNLKVLGIFYHICQINRELIMVQYDGKNFISEKNYVFSYGEIRYWISIPELPPLSKGTYNE